MCRDSSRWDPARRRRLPCLAEATTAGARYRRARRSVHAPRPHLLLPFLPRCAHIYVRRFSRGHPQRGPAVVLDAVRTAQLRSQGTPRPISAQRDETVSLRKLCTPPRITFVLTTHLARSELARPLTNINHSLFQQASFVKASTSDDGRKRSTQRTHARVCSCALVAQRLTRLARSAYTGRICSSAGS